jgi:folate-binding protein YgfZ
MCGEGNVFTLPNTFLGIKGIAICLSRDSVEDVWKNYVEQGVKPIGWYALNMARVERGAPVFMIDFDSNALPHETSLTASRVSFNKGCYLGQEVVARMESLGQPKQRLMQLQMDSEELPIASAQLWDDNKAGSGTPIGVVTSSAISPLRGGVPTAIAMIGKKHANPNTKTYLFVGPETLSANLTELLLISNDEIS